MESRELAERVLFGTTLDEKLTEGGRFQDSTPAPALVTPDRPGRPLSLALDSWHGRERVRFRELRRFHTEKERGLVLHFFANHELLAIELMALALLKFPDASEKFRRGLYGTLREEQEHLTLYIERMESLGVEFGEIPVSDFFWRSISTMGTPLDFVSRLSLTLEQANLDYAPYYANVYEKLGDTETASLMQRIYRDEIGHVKFGMLWFSAWRDPKLSEWEAYNRSLSPPLHPSRAKGIGFNAEGRRRAGLSEDFIAELEVHSQSRGRCPDVFWFNPSCDRYAGLNSTAYTPSQTVADMARDFETLPSLLCKADDVVLVRERPSNEFLRNLQAAGLVLPEFVDTGFLSSGHEPPLAGRKLHKLCPWGVSPDSDELLASLGGNLASVVSPMRWSSDVRTLYSKAFSVSLLRGFLQTRKEGWLCEEDTVGTVNESEENVWRAVAELRGQGWERVLIKACFGSAGQGQVRLTGSEMGVDMEKKRRWVSRLLREQGPVVVEPWLNGVVDLSAHYDVDAGRTNFLGTKRFITDARGQYLGSFLHGTATDLNENTRRFLYGDGKEGRRLCHLFEDLGGFLCSRAAEVGYRGPIGVDALVYRSESKLRLKPVIEVNPRFTMGRVAMHLARRVNASRIALWLIVRACDVAAAGYAMGDFAHELQRRFPLEMSRDGEQVSKGVLFTTDPKKAKAFLTVLITAESLAQCKSAFAFWPGRLSEWTRRC